MASYIINDAELENASPLKDHKTSLKESIFKYLLYWPLFLGLLLISLAAAWLYLRFTNPVYETTATLLIKDEKKGTDDAKVLEALNFFGSKKIVENEIEVLKSKTLAQETVKNLHLYASILEDGKFADHSAYLSSPIRIIAENPDLVKEVKKQYFQYNAVSKKIIINKVVYPLNTWATTPYGTLKFILNPDYSPSINQKPLFFSLASIKNVANNIVERLNITAANKLSTVIDLSIKDEVPKRGEDILNELIVVYNKASAKDKNYLAANTLSFVDDRLKYVVKELDSIERQLQQFRAKNNIVDISTQGKLFLENVGSNDQKIGDISMQLAVLNQVESYVLHKGNDGGIVPSTLGVTDPVLSSLLEKLYTAELEYEKTRKIAPENNPILISLADQISKIKPSILENIENQRRNLQAGKSDLNTTNSRYISLLQTMPEKERELLEISRQQTIKNNIYTFLLQKREEAALSYASVVGDSRLIDKAQSSDHPVSPKGMLVYLVAIVAALIVGFMFIWLREVLNNNIDSKEEVKSYTHMPVLGEVAYNNTNELVVVKDDAKNLIAEQFRQVRTSLTYLGINARKKKILITSSISGEGKSFIAVNLSISLAMADKKVVLLELDLRKPKIAELLKVAHSTGISDYLQGQKDIEEIIRSAGINKNLFIIPAGTIPLHPSELLTNDRLEELFIYLERTFDYIIMDSSPIIPVTDAYILSPLCDATLFVIRQGVTPKSIIQKLDEDFRTKGLNNPAIILNGIKGKEFNKYNYNYSYGYNYINDKRKSLSRKGLKKLFS